MEHFYDFRLYPNKKQEFLIQKTFGCCRYIFNHYLAERKQNKEDQPSFSDCSKNMTTLKKSLTWLREVDSTALQSALREVHASCKNKRENVIEFPGFRKKHTSTQSFKSICVGENIKIFSNAIQLPKLGKIKCRISRTVQGRIRHAIVRKKGSGKYFVCIRSVDAENMVWQKTGKTVRVSREIGIFAKTSDGEICSESASMAQVQRKLTKFQKKFSRKTKGSLRMGKARLKRARMQERLVNQRNDMLHKFSTKLVKENDVICLVEKPSPEKTNSAQKNQNWNELCKKLVQKADRQGKKVIFSEEDLNCRIG